MADATIADLIDRIKAEGQLTRNTGTNSIKATNFILAHIHEVMADLTDVMMEQTSVLDDFIDDSARLAALAGLNNQADEEEKKKKEEEDDKVAGPKLSLLAKLGAGALGAVIGMFRGWVNAIRFFKLGKIVDAIESVGSSIVKSIKNFGTMGLNVIKNIKSAVFGVTSPLSRIVEPFVDAGRAIVTLVKDVLGFGKTVSKIGGYFGSLLKIVKNISGLVSRIFLPLTIIMTAFDTIKDAIAGYAEGGILGAFEGAVTGFFNSLIFGPLDLLKDMTSWVLGKLGFENASETLDSFSFSDLFSQLVGGVFDLIGDLFGALTQSFTNVLDAFKTGDAWTVAGTLITEYFQLMVMKPLDLLKDLVSWAADLFGFENASAWLDSFSFSEMFTSVVDWISALPTKIVEYFQDMWIDAKGKLLSGMAAFAFWVGGLGDRIYLSVLEYLKGTTVGGYLVDEEMVANARATVSANASGAAAVQQQIMASTEAEKKAMLEERVQRHAQEAAARQSAAPAAPTVVSQSGGNNNSTNTTATQVTNYYANQGTALDGAYMPF